MLVAGRGYRLARLTLTISKCPCSHYSALAKDTSASGPSKARSGASRSREGRVVSTQLVQCKGRSSSTKGESSDVDDFGAVGEGGLCKDSSDRVTASASSASPTRYRVRSGGAISSAKPSRRMEWLEYQSMLRERTGLLRRSKPGEQAFGTNNSTALHADVDNCGVRASGRWKPTAEPCSSAPANVTTAQISYGDPINDQSRAVESNNSRRSKSPRGSRESVRENKPGSTISGESVFLSRSNGMKALKCEAAAAPESELLFGKPTELGGIEEPQSNGTGWETTEGNLEAQQQHSVDGMPPDSVYIGDGPWGERFRSLGENSSVVAPGEKRRQAAYLSESMRLFDHHHWKSGEAWLSRRNFTESAGSSTISHGREGEDVGGDEPEGGRAFRAATVPKEEPCRLEHMFGRPPSVANRRIPAATHGRIPEAPSTHCDATTAASISPSGRREHHEEKPIEDCGNPSPKKRCRGKRSAGVEGEKSRGDDDTVSHSALPGSAWKNVHARSKLKALLAGLSSDYGVQEMLEEHYIHEHTRSKLLETFQERVLDEPDTVFPGESGQDAQRAISKLCYHGNFQASAVMKKKPIKAKGSFGRTYTFAIPPPSSPESPENAVKENKRGKFPNARAELVQSVFIPRLVDLALELFPAELENTKRMENIVDLRNPQEWYPLARLRKRRIIYHGGPTNSGKTYQAIERLKKAGANREQGDGPAGLFCGPLRLLALEVYEQLNSQGVYCSLMTGQERREVPFATHVSCTIEMANTSHEYEVAVIDEIQMLADEQRGPSWTSAVLGLNCPEIHVCGGMEGAVLVEALAKEMGDDFELREYQRKTKLVCAEESLHNNYKHVEPGDAVVAFSRKDIFSIKREIESKTNHRCCVIYGSLPQETRAHQARLFNTEGTGYDVLVASDAIGMGLNLNIRRVIFHTVSKRANAGRGTVKLPPTMLKQIGGRAGRHGKGWEFGEVTCLKEADMAYMNHVMSTSLSPIPRAGIFPSVERMQIFSDCLDATEPKSKGRRRLAETFAEFAERAKVGDRYFLGTHDQHQVLANALHPVENLTLKERYAISMAPVNSKNALLIRAIVLFARAHAAGLPAFINMQLPQKGVLPKSMQEFQTLCSKHNVLDLYKWMSVRFPTIECFAEKSVAEMQRNELESIIASSLKTNISVVGPSEITNHQSFDPRVLKELKIPEGAGGGGGFDRSIPYPGEEDEFEEAEDNAYTLP